LKAPVTPATTRDADSVVALIASRCDPSCRWKVTAAEVRDELGIDPLAFYRALYAAATAERSVLDLGDITGTFTDESPEALLAALEVFCGARTEESLARAGIFFSHASRVDIIETYMSVAADAIAHHVYDAAEVSAMLRSLGSCDAARSAYLRTHFPAAGLVEETVERFSAGRRFGIPALARANVRRLIEFFFRRHVLNEGAIFAALFQRIREQAIDEGYLEDEGSRAAAGDDSSTAPDAVEAAQRALGVAGLPLSRRLLRDRYRALMKRFHPDVNPGGLERAKEINAAYSRLLDALS
jgi:hypothetical protein